MIYVLFGMACVVSYLIGMWVGVSIAAAEAQKKLDEIVNLYEAQRKVDELYGRRR